MDHYNILSEGYDELYGEEQKAKAKLILDNIDINKEDSLLDIGCGTGIATNLFPCNKTGIDPSEKLLEKANFPVKKAKAESLPFEDNQFDIIISLTALHHCDIEKALKEAKRVGKRLFIFSILKKANNFNNIKEKIEEYFIVEKTLEEKKDTIFICRK